MHSKWKQRLHETDCELVRMMLLLLLLLLLLL